MFSKWEKAALVITGIELLVLHVGMSSLKKKVAGDLGVSVRDMMKIKTKAEYDALKNKREA